MKGIVLAGGAGTRLHPLTLAMSKPLIPIYDKPMIYYPLSTLMLAGIREIAIVTTAEDQPVLKRLLSDGEQWGLKLEYLLQPTPEGIAQAFILAEDYIGGEPSALILGDNIYFGQGLPELLRGAAPAKDGATIFGYHMADPRGYGVVECDTDGRAISIEEKPIRPKSNYAVTGLYFYDGRVSEFARTLRRSARDRLEITDLNNLYLEAGALTVKVLGQGFAWLDTGSHETLIQAGEFVRTIENRQGLKIGCPEEVAYRAGFIDRERLLELARRLEKSNYGSYLRQIANQPGPLPFADRRRPATV